MKSIICSLPITEYHLPCSCACMPLTSALCLSWPPCPLPTACATLPCPHYRHVVSLHPATPCATCCALVAACIASCHHAPCHHMCHVTVRLQCCIVPFLVLSSYAGPLDTQRLLRVELTKLRGHMMDQVTGHV